MTILHATETVDDLDIARAKIAYAKTAGLTKDATWGELSESTRNLYINAAREIRRSDAARGVQSVPVEATEIQLLRGDAADCEHARLTHGEALPVEEVYRTMLTASPFYTNPEDENAEA